MKRSLTALMRDVGFYKPDKDNSVPVKFSDIATQFPAASVTDGQAIVGMADFAELGYCPYKSWHRGRGTPENRTAEEEAALRRGQDFHTKREAADRAVLKTLPKATQTQFRDASVNIAEVPEFPTRVRFGGLIYSSRVERAGRYQKNLTIMEMKTGDFIGGTDHFLQTWGYCISAPGTLSSGWGLTADRIQWRVEYPQARKILGPYTFSERAFSLVLEAMEHFEQLYAAGQTNDTKVESLSVSSAKCRKCAFVKHCSWGKIAASQTGRWS